MKNLDAHLNNFATRCFRDVADRDYISARMCYRASLISQFHWSALQAFEKYYKAILLYNRIEAKHVNHDLAKAQKRTEKAPFNIRLSDSSVELMKYLDDYGRFRYLETSYFIYGPKLFELDKAVWELRRYCRVIDYHHPSRGTARKSMLKHELQCNEMAEHRPHQDFRVVGGLLERIIENKSHPARASLIWQNGFYGRAHRKRVTVPTSTYAENSPLSLQPELLDHVLKYIFLPNEVINAYLVERRTESG